LKRCENDSALAFGIGTSDGQERKRRARCVGPVRSGDRAKGVKTRMYSALRKLLQGYKLLLLGSANADGGVVEGEGGGGRKVLGNRGGE